MPTTIVAECPHCQNKKTVPAEWVGRRAKCTHCGQAFVVATTMAPPSTPPARNTAAPAKSPPPIGQPMAACASMGSSDGVSETWEIADESAAVDSGQDAEGEPFGFVPAPESRHTQLHDSIDEVGIPKEPSYYGYSEAVLGASLVIVLLVLAVGLVMLAVGTVTVLGDSRQVYLVASGGAAVLWALLMMAGIASGMVILDQARNIRVMRYRRHFD